MKKFLLTLLASYAGIIAFGQGSESFTNVPTAGNPSYSSRSWTGDVYNVAWSATDSRSDSAINGRAITIRNGAITATAIPNGIGSLSFKHQQIFSGTNSVLEVRVNDVLVGKANPTTTLQIATIDNINVSGTFKLEIKQVTSNLRIKIDDVTWTSGSTTPCVTPTAQPTSLTFNNITNTSITGSFTAASPAADQYLVVMSTSSTLSATPQNGTSYTEGDEIGNGNVVVTTNNPSFTVANLNAGTAYYFSVFAVNTSCIGGPLYNTAAPLTGNVSTTSPPACVAPSGTPGALTLNPASTSVNGSFTSATGADGYLVVRSTNSTLSFTPANGTSYSNGQTVGAGNSGTVVKSSPGTTFSSTGLTPKTAYYFYVYAVSGFTCTGGPLYNTTAVTGTTTTTESGSSSIPPHYYDTVTTQSCADLKSVLKWRTTSGMTPKTYGDLWNQYTVSDVKPREIVYPEPNTTPNVIWDIYSDNPTGIDPYNFDATPSGGLRKSCSGFNYSNEGDCYNREHSVPQNWFGANASPSSVGPESDYHHIFPTDGKVNGMRSNYIYGEVSTPTYTSANGSKLGSSANGFSGPVFEPINEYKGDVARAFLYFVTRYQDNMPTYTGGTAGAQAFDQSTYPSVDVPYLQLMLKWHHQDPVSAKEIDRNNAAYVYQGNRNPYIDHPEYADVVWNNTCSGLSALPVNLIFFSGKLVGDKINLEWVADNELNFDRYEIERSLNGTSFTKIGQVPAANLHNYSFSDNADALKGQRVYYRLKKVDKDGNFKYSGVFTIHIPLNTKFSVYPNPAKSYIQLNINKNVSGKVTVQLSNALGKVLQQQTYNVTGSFIRLNAEDLSTGTYLVKMIYNGEQYIQKVMVVK